MHFVLYCLDKPGSVQIRLDNRAAHLAYANSFGDAVSFAGPLLTDDGEGMLGSLIVLNMNDRAEVDVFIADDPYGLAGLFQSVTVHAYKLAIANHR